MKDKYDSHYEALEPNQPDCLILTLDFTANPLDKAQAEHLAAAISHNNVIKAIDLKGIPKEFLPELIAAIESNASLKYVRLSYQEDSKLIRVDTSDLLQTKIVTTFDDTWKIFFPKSEKLAAAWDSDQTLYAKLCLESVYAATSLLKAEKLTTAWQLYNFLSKQRHDIGSYLQQPNTAELGLSRLTDKRYARGLTSINDTNRYADFYPLLRERLASEIKKANTTGTIKICPFIDIKFNDIYLSQLVLYPDFIKIHHTEARDIDRIIDLIEPLYNLALCDELSSSKRVKALAKVTWLLAHACPNVRGSAATTELFVRVLMLKMGLALTPYTSVIPLDLEAIFNPDINDFTQKFSRFFSLMPLPEKSMTDFFKHAVKGEPDAKNPILEEILSLAPSPSVI